MRFSNSFLTAYHISGVLAVLVSLKTVDSIVAEPAYQSFASSWLMYLTSLLVTLVPGLLALFGRTPIFLPVAWGWVLGGALPQLLYLPQPLKGLGIHIDYGRNYLDIAACTIAVAGLVLYFVGVYRERRDLKV
jgi:hypothetical protein